MGQSKNTGPSEVYHSSDQIQAAQLLFAVVLLALAVILLSQITTQTQFIDGKRFVDQPGFWPAVSLSGMALFGGLRVFFLFRERLGNQPSLFEVSCWVKALEYVIWFLVYVWLVPLIGYLPGTLVFCPLLTLRLGYRSKFAVLCALAAGLFVVILFKTLLQVKIPGGEIYEYFPAVVRNVLIVYFLTK